MNLNGAPFGSAWLPQNQDPSKTPKFDGTTTLPTNLFRPYLGYGDILMYSFGANWVKEDGVTTWYFPRQTRFYNASWPLTRWLAGHLGEYDLVHTHALFSYSTTVSALLAAKRHVPAGGNDPPQRVGVCQVQHVAAGPVRGEPVAPCPQHADGNAQAQRHGRGEDG